MELTITLSRSQARWDSNTWALSLRSDFGPCVTAPYVGVRFCLVLSFLSLFLCLPSRARLFLLGLIQCQARADLQPTSQRRLSPESQSLQPKLQGLLKIAMLFHHKHRRSFGFRLYKRCTVQRQLKK